MSLPTIYIIIGGKATSERRTAKRSVDFQNINRKARRKKNRKERKINESKERKTNKILSTTEI